MAYGLDSLEKRWKDNIKNYTLGHLFDLNQLNEYLKMIARATDTEVLLTGRDGEKVVAIGNFLNYAPAEEKQTNRKIIVSGRTLGYLYIKKSEAVPEKSDLLEKMYDQIIQELTLHAELSYKQDETVIYADEIESRLEKEKYRVKHGEKEDALTGIMNSTYFESRLQVIDRSQIVPVAVIAGNINDWKYVNDHYGDEESDRLIKVVASILKEEAKPDYVIGRVEGDAFHILIPMAEKEEANEFCKRVQERCMAFEDECIAPSIAFGAVMKTNVEENLHDLFSDAEYEMFQNKFELKNADGYRERLEKK